MRPETPDPDSDRIFNHFDLQGYWVNLTQDLWLEVEVYENETMFLSGSFGMEKTGFLMEKKDIFKFEGSTETKLVNRGERQVGGLT